jgi:hypothetical protein
VTDDKPSISSLIAVIWHDPVWSAVIAGLIVTAVVGIAGGIWRGRRWKSTGVAALIILCGLLAWHFSAALTKWRTTPVQISRGALLAVVVAVFMLIWLLVRRQHGPPMLVSAAAPMPPSRSIPEDYHLSDIQHVAARVMLDCYPQRLDLAELHVRIARPTPLDQALGRPPTLSRGRLAREMEDLEQAGIVWIDHVARTLSYYHLTDVGRDWLLDNLGRE